MAFTEIIGVNIATIAGIVAVLLFVLGMTKQYKSKRTKKTANFLAIVGIGVFLVAAFGANLGVPSNFIDPLVNPLMDGSAQVATTTTQVVTPSVAGCAVEDTTVTLAGVNTYTTAAVGGQHIYKVNGNPLKRVSDAGTFTASPGDTLEILWANGTDTTEFFSKLSTESVPCAGTATFSADLYSNGTVTVNVFSEEDELIAGDTIVNETLANGDTVTLPVEIKGQYQKGIPLGARMVVEYNSSMFDNIIVDFGNTVPLENPRFATVLSTANAFLTFEIPPILGNEIMDGTIYFDVDDTYDPGVPSNVTYTIYYNNYFINEDTGGSFDIGIEDEDFAQVWGGTTAGTITFD